MLLIFCNVVYACPLQGKRVVDSQGNTLISDTFYENSLLLADNKRLQQRLKAMQETINILTERNAQLKLEKQTHEWSKDENSDVTVSTMVLGYLSEIERLQAKVIETEEMCQQLKKQSLGTTARATKSTYDGK